MATGGGELAFEMHDIVNRPGLLFLLVGVVLWGVARLGAEARRRRPLADDTRSDFSLLLSAALTLLALLVGFSFSFASSRYDQRKALEEAEANAIGTEYARADLLPKGDAAKVRELLKRINAETSALQGELWKAVLGPAEASPTPVMALVVTGMNEVLIAQGYTQAAWWNRMPGSHWGFLIAVAVCCNFLIGYGLRSSKSERRLLYVFPVLITIALTVLADIDAPRRGTIQIEPQNLKAVLQSMRSG